MAESRASNSRGKARRPRRYRSNSFPKWASCRTLMNGLIFLKKSLHKRLLSSMVGWLSLKSMEGRGAIPRVERDAHDGEGWFRGGSKSRLKSSI